MPESVRIKPSPREIEVLRLAVSGLSDKEIAGVLGIAQATVRKHIENLSEKLDAHNRCQLTQIALEEGLVQSARSLP
jgi:two-component system nitrate/nitrite response regulator NarL